MYYCSKYKVSKMSIIQITFLKDLGNHHHIFLKKGTVLFHQYPILFYQSVFKSLPIIAIYCWQKLLLLLQEHLALHKFTSKDLFSRELDSTIAVFLIRQPWVRYFRSFFSQVFHVRGGGGLCTKEIITPAFLLPFWRFNTLTQW